MKKILLVIFLSLILTACSKQQVPIYKMNEEVKFVDSSKGSIKLINKSSKYDDSITFSFSIVLNEELSFDDLFSNYSIEIDQKGIDLRHFNDDLLPTNLKSDYYVIINDIFIDINKLSDYKFAVGESIISFEFGSNYINKKNSKASLMFMFDRIIPFSVFSL